MKKVFMFAIGVLVAGATKAQTSGSKDIQFGVKAGVNFSNVIKTRDDNFKTTFKPGFNAGVFVEVPIIDRLSFAPEVVFSQKGYKSTSTFLGTDYEYSVTTNFIEVPILAKINATDAFSVFLGPQVSFLASTATKFTKGDDSYQNLVKETNKNLKKSLFGGVVGVGFDVTPQVNINARYALDFQKNNENGTSETPVYKNQVFQLSLGYRF
jgi:Outer membrane protein beta-barrel domain